MMLKPYAVSLCREAGVTMFASPNNCWFTFRHYQKVMKKLEPPKTSKPTDGVSDMPDAILLLILSRLPSTEEAIRSSILSRRWRNLWTAIPSLDIHDGGKFKKSEFKEFVYWVLVKRSVDLDCFRFVLFASLQYVDSRALD
ncbi:unnamed protein product [Lactuca virosa]|uniref:F-box domain-containing protein n=1 Tax=Lactuca virosa TaxID=75947 RepID=A0AAU9MLD6_9ASTR|nr:unnamed protein product [Lactuca virosa]